MPILRTSHKQEVCTRLLQCMNEEDEVKVRTAITIVLLSSHLHDSRWKRSLEVNCTAANQTSVCLSVRLTVPSARIKQNLKRLRHPLMNLMERKNRDRLGETLLKLPNIIFLSRLISHIELHKVMSTQKCHTSKKSEY